MGLEPLYESLGLLALGVAIGALAYLSIEFRDKDAIMLLILVALILLGYLDPSSLFRGIVIEITI